jgi:hypothetical protein
MTIEAMSALGPLTRLAQLGKKQESTPSVDGKMSNTPPAFLEANMDNLSTVGIHVQACQNTFTTGTWKTWTDARCPRSQDRTTGASRFQQPSRYVDVRCHYNRCEGKGLNDRIIPTSSRAHTS